MEYKYRIVAETNGGGETWYCPEKLRCTIGWGSFDVFFWTPVGDKVFNAESEARRVISEHGRMVALENSKRIIHRKVIKI